MFSRFVSSLVVGCVMARTPSRSVRDLTFGIGQRSRSPAFADYGLLVLGGDAGVAHHRELIAQLLGVGEGLTRHGARNQLVESVAVEGEQGLAQRAGVG